MPERPTEETPRKAAKTSEKSARLAEALRRNLALRKAQQRARADGAPAQDSPEE